MQKRKLPLCLALIVVFGAFATATQVKFGGYYDEYGNMPWPEERLHLDNFAHFLELKPDYDGYIAIYPGPRESRKNAANAS